MEKTAERDGEMWAYVVLARATVEKAFADLGSSDPLEYLDARRWLLDPVGGLAWLEELGYHPDAIRRQVQARPMAPQARVRYAKYLRQRLPIKINQFYRQAVRACGHSMGG